MKVLIIEDNVILAATMEIMLRKLGYKDVKKVHSGEDAIELLSKFKAELLLVDINLGTGISGIDVVKKVQAERKALVVYITGNSDEHHKKMVQETDYLEYLVKPITLVELKNSINIDSPVSGI